ncbi:MAG: ABC transporter permease [Desulfobacteraceae bacterium]|nr:ABC transporter permease [Desulfobacteraceae bacterium]
MNKLAQFTRRKNLVIGAIVTVVMIIMAIFAPLIAPYDPIYDADLMVAEEPPSSSYIFGTDDQGRDIFSRVVYGARISLSVGLISQLMNSIIGITLGLLAGYFGKWVDDLIMGLTNIMLSIPSIIFALAIMALLGPGLINVFIALGFTNWSYTCRITRSQALYTKNLNYVNASRALSYGEVNIMFTQILPNIVGPILVIATLGISGAILIEASLSFLGLGTQPPTPSWGGMLATAREQLFTAPWISIFPGMFIFLTVLGLNLFGDGLRDLLDPHTSQRK